MLWKGNEGHIEDAAKIVLIFIMIFCEENQKFFLGLNPMLYSVTAEKKMKCMYD